MCIKFDLSNTSQSRVFFEDLNSKVSNKLIDFSKEHTNVGRSLGLLLAFGFPLLKLAQVVADVGEPLIKGLANVFGSLVSKECSFSKGVKQLVLQLPLHLISSAIEWPIETACEIVTPIYMLISPIAALVSRKIKAETRKCLIDVVINDRAYELPDANPMLKKMVEMNLKIMKFMYV